MLTHEKVLKVFGPYLDADPDYEVVKTSRGYTLLAWNNRRSARPRRTCGMPC